MKRSIAAALIGFAVYAPTWADTIQTSIALTNFNVQITDLQPGGAPSWVWAKNSTAQTVSAAYPASGGIETDALPTWRQTTSVDTATASASTSPTSFQATAGLVNAVSGQFQATSAYADTGAIQVLLAPQTSLTLSGSFTASMFSDAAAGSDDSTITALLWVGTGNGLSDELYWEENGAVNDTKSDLLSVTYANTTSRPQYVQLGASVTVQATIYDAQTAVQAVAAVPEPATYAQMLVGLAALAGLARRYRKS